ncbi:MAG: hypothetical protein ACLQPH_11495 [Acidimicrobiales bacterium]
MDRGKLAKLVFDMARQVFEIDPMHTFDFDVRTLVADPHPPMASPSPLESVHQRTDRRKRVLESHGCPSLPE